MRLARALGPCLPGLLALASCGEALPPAEGQASATRVLSLEPLVVEVRLATAGERMAFDHESFEVPAGAEVRLIFRNAAPTPMFHNWVLVERGSEEEILSGAVPAGYERAWVPDHPGVLAATGAPRPGEESAVTFQAPPPGVYPYLCTVPGHGAMRGRLIVRAVERRR